MRLRRQGPAQSRQGFPDAVSVFRAGPHACERRATSVCGYSQVLILIARQPKSDRQMSDNNMSDNCKPRDHKDIETAVQWAIAEGKSLEIVGHGSKRMLGRPAQYDATIDLSGMTGVTLYEPQELVLSARAGTPLAEITTLLASNGQELAFEPMDYGALFG